MAIETIEHKGYKITFDVADRGKGWTWTLQIDSGPVMANTGATHPNEILARLEAIAVAEREIESAARVAAASVILGAAPSNQFCREDQCTSLPSCLDPNRVRI